MIGIIFWAAVAVTAGVVEAGTTALVSLWFVGGALAALIATLAGAQLWLQVVLFFGVSLLLFLLLRPVLRRSRRVATNADSNLGRTAVVTEAIDNVAGTGQVKIGGVAWTARSVDGAPIAAGSLVTIQSIDGVKVIVAQQKEAASAAEPTP